MKINQIEFIGSFPSYTKTPADNLPNFAFIGRSNVGKSSLINTLVGRKELARVSNTPGKTQLINYYKINDSWYLVDLPGYGYAKISKSTREKWTQMIQQYLIKKDTLACVFVLLDSRHELQKKDQEFIQWCGENKIPMVFVFTKADKLRPSVRASKIKRLRKDLLRDWEYLPDTFITSAETGEGRDEVLEFIEGVLDKIIE